MHQGVQWQTEIPISCDITKSNNISEKNTQKIGKDERKKNRAINSYGVRFGEPRSG